MVVISAWNDCYMYVKKQRKSFLVAIQRGIHLDYKFLRKLIVVICATAVMIVVSGSRKKVDSYYNTTSSTLKLYFYEYK